MWPTFSHKGSIYDVCEMSINKFILAFTGGRWDTSIKYVSIFFTTDGMNRCEISEVFCVEVVFEKMGADICPRPWHWLGLYYLI